MGIMGDEVRHVARVLIINDQDQTFLLRGQDITLPDRAPFWFTPGGKIDTGETPKQAAVRELNEEVGLSIQADALGEIVGTESSDYHFHGQAYRQIGVFYVHFSNEARLNSDGWSEIEANTIDQGKWWSVQELSTTLETIYPAHLVYMLTDALALGPREPEAL